MNTVFRNSAHELRIYAGWNAQTERPTGPTFVIREDRPGSYVETLTMSAAPAVDDNGRPTGTEEIGGLQTLSRSYISAGGQVTHTDSYFLLTGLVYTAAVNLGTANVNFYRRTFGYDQRGRLERELSPTGTINRQVYDGLGRLVSTWVGTNDTPLTGFWSPSNPAGMTRTASYEYDGGGVGDSNLTRVTELPGGGSDSRVSDFFYDWRDRLIATKSGVQVIESASTQRPIFYLQYDNLSQVTVSEQYDGDGVSIVDLDNNGIPDRPSATLLRARDTFEYDEQGRAFRTHTFLVNQTTGAVSADSLTTDAFFNHRGLLVKTASPGGLVEKWRYDGAGRATFVFSSDGNGDNTWAEALTLNQDNVLEQTQFVRDANGNVILTIHKDRFHDEDRKGELGDPNSRPRARVSYAAAYYDAIDRPTATVNVGTNGGTAYTRPALVPGRSDTVLVTSYTYNDAGWLDETTDPRGIKSKIFYDNLGREAKVVEAYTDGVITNTTNKTVTFTYDGNDNLLTLTAYQTGGAFQTTQYVRGVTIAAGSAIDSNDLVAEVRYPDKTTGLPSATDKEVYTYNALGEVTTFTDRNGTKHEYTRDVLGRLTADSITILGAGVDGAVRRIEIGYDTAGRASLFTQFDAAIGGNIVNQVLRQFNGFGQVTAEYQAHAGAVNVLTTPAVRYVYSEMQGGANHSRLTQVIYPNGRTISYNYSNNLDDRISRLTSISDNSGILERYEYLGLSTVVLRAHPQPNVDLSFIKRNNESTGDAGDKYNGLDRFGRVVDQRWRKNNTDVDRFKYGYDRNSSRTFRENTLNAAFSELYEYDTLNQLDEFFRGTLNAAKTAIVGAPSRSQNFNPDATGNFNSVTTNGVTENRTHNQQNELTSISGNALTFDNNGNLTTDEQGRTYEYDAWNRLLRVKAPGGAILVEFGYDALNRRTTETSSGTTTDLFYTTAWQVVEERVGGVARVQYVWSPVYVDAMILRDRDTDNNGSLNERLWVLQDANYNVTAVVDNNGNVVERYAYDPFGTRTVYSPSWTLRASSAFSMTVGFQGLRHDATTGLLDNRGRILNPTLMRPLQPDAIGFAADVNFYRYEANHPTSALDPNGLSSEDWMWKWHWHHLLPQEIFKPEILKELKLDKIIDINSSEFGYMIQGGSHIGEGGIHPSGWNTDWSDWLKREQDAGRPITKETIQKRLTEMMEGEKYAKHYTKGKKAEVTYTIWKTKCAERAAEKAAKEALEKALIGAEKQAAKGSGLLARGAKKLLGPLAVLFFWSQDVKAKGLAGGTANSLLDAFLPVGLPKAGIELMTGQDIIPDKGKESLITPKSPKQTSPDGMNYEGTRIYRATP